jgi:hypothetical protein
MEIRRSVEHRIERFNDVRVLGSACAWVIKKAWVPLAAATPPAANIKGLCVVTE